MVVVLLQRRRLKVLVLERRGLRVDSGARVVAGRRVRLIVVSLQMRMVVTGETVGGRR